MPYKIVEVEKNKYKVKKKQPGPSVYFSKKPMTKEKAIKQMRALYLSEKKIK